MVRNKKIFFISFLFILSSINIVGAKEKGNVISLSAFINSYMSHSYDLKQQYESLRSSQGNKLSVESADDLSFDASAGYNNATSVSVLNQDKTLNSVSTSAGLSKHFSASGTSISLSDSFGSGKISGVDSENSNHVTLEVMQPVLKNFFGFIDRNNIKSAALEVKSNELLYQESIETNIVDAINLYLSWVGYVKEKEILSSIIKNNQIIFNQTKAKLRAGIAEVSDLEISRNSVIQYQKQYLVNKNNYESTMLQLNDYLKISPNDKPDMNVTEFSLDLLNADIDPNYIRTIRQVNALLHEAKLGLATAKNNYLPSLNLLLNYSLVSGDGTDYSGSSSGDLFPAAATGKNNFYAGFNMSLPVFFMSARAQDIMALANYQKILLQRDQAVRDIIRNVKDLKNQVNVMIETLGQQKSLITSLTRQVASQKMQYRRGTLDLDNLIRGMNDLSNAQLEYNNYKIQAHELYNDYLQLIDKLSEKYSASLPKEILL